MEWLLFPKWSQHPPPFNLIRGKTVTIHYNATKTFYDCNLIKSLLSTLLETNGTNQASFLWTLLYVFLCGLPAITFFANDDCSEAIKYLFYLFYTFGRCGVSHLRILRIKIQAFLEFYKKCQECLDGLTNKGGFKKVAKFIL